MDTPEALPMSRRDDDRDVPRRDQEKGIPTAVLVLGLLVLTLFGIAAVGGVVYLLRGRAATQEAQLLQAEALQARAAAMKAEARARAAEAAVRPAPVSRDD